MFRKRVTLTQNYEALEFARSLGVTVAINLIADPSWDRERFRVIREWCMEIPEIVNISVNTPYPGTESWRTEARRINTRDYRLFDIQHAVLPTYLSLADFYEELVETQRVLSIKHLGFSALREAAGLAAGRLLRGQTNFVRMLWKFNSVYNPKLQIADHQQPVQYEISPPPEWEERIGRGTLYVHTSGGRKARAIDNATEAFVEVHPHGGRPSVVELRLQFLATDFTDFTDYGMVVVCVGPVALYRHHVLRVTLGIATSQLRPNR